MVAFVAESSPRGGGAYSKPSILSKTSKAIVKNGDDSLNSQYIPFVTTLLQMGMT